MTSTPPPRSDEDTGPRFSTDQLRDLSVLRRAVGEQSRVFGVCGGLGRHFDVDPVLFRVLFVVLIFFGGAGLWLYAALWLLVPDDNGSVTLSLEPRTRHVVLLVLGLVAVIATLGDVWGGWGLSWPVVISVVIALLIYRKTQRKAVEHGGPPHPYAAPGWGPGATGAGAQADETVDLTKHDATGTPAGAQAGTATDPVSGAPAASWTYPSEQQAPGPYAGTGYYPGPPYPPAPPRNPLKRGPILFWFTLALVALGLGVTGLVDMASTGVPFSAYPAVALGVTGLMLVLGAFYGRAGGLIALGLAALLALVGSTAVEQLPSQDRSYAPTLSQDVRDEYYLGTGDLRIDLSRVRDIDQLDGRSLEIGLGAGELELVVPEEMDVSVNGSNGAGEMTLFGQRHEGVGMDEKAFNDGGDAAADMRVEIYTGTGTIEVTRG